MPTSTLRCGGLQRDRNGRRPHNLVRHPDVPKAAFADVARLQQGKGWMGLVKNRAKGGQFCWVSASRRSSAISGGSSANTSLSDPSPGSRHRLGSSSMRIVTARRCPG